MAKFPSADDPRPPTLNVELLRAVKDILRSLPKGTQTPELTSTALEVYLKQQGIAAVRLEDLKQVLLKLTRDGLIRADFSRIGNWYILWINPDTQY